MTSTQSNEITFLKNQRSGIKGRVTYFKNKFEKERPALSADELQSMLNRLQVVYTKFDDCQTEIERQDTSEFSSDQRNIFDDEYGALESLIICEIHKRNKPLLVKQSSSTGDTTIPNNSPIIKLPEIPLPEFDGDYLKWLRFRHSFVDMIHGNQDLSDSSKMHYLLAALRKGSALQYVDAFPSNGESYKKAWKALVELYDNDSRLVRHYMKELYEVKCVIEYSHKSLQFFIDNVNRNYNALKSLGQSVEHWDLMLVHHLSTKLDKFTRSEIEKKTPTKSLLKLTEFIDFLNVRVRVLEAITPVTSVRFNNNKPIQRTTTLLSSSVSCQKCGQPHWLYKCTQFLNLSMDDRYSFVDKYNLCNNCLHRHESKSICKYGSCRICKQKHHTLLHRELRTPSIPIKISRSNTSSSINDESLGANGTISCSLVDEHDHCIQPTKAECQVLLGTAIIRIYDTTETSHLCRALIDSASQSNYMTERLRQRLCLQKQFSLTPVEGINDTKSASTHRVITSIGSRNSTFETQMEFLIVPKIVGYLPQHRIQRIENLSGIELADPEYNIPGNVDILIGASRYSDIVTGERQIINRNFPPLLGSVFGFLIIGEIPYNTFAKSFSLTSTVQDLHSQIQAFWQLENIDNTQPLTPEERMCEKHFSSNVKRDCNGRYSVALPTRTNYTKLGKSAEISKRQFIQQEKRLHQLPEIRQMYIKFMEEYLQLHHMEPVHDIDISDVDNNIAFYFPHHSVLKPTSTTTKLRVVFNGSSKSSSGLSLNDVLMVGPTVQRDLFSVILRFRRHQYAMTADITKMYRQINVHKNQRDLQRIWWRSSSKDPLKCYRLSTVTYGTASAAFLATRCLKQLALDEQDSFLSASYVVINDFYVDDLLTGAATIEEAQQLKTELTSLLARGGFELCKWASSDPRVLQSSHSKPTNQDEGQTFTLGLQWQPSDDKFLISIGPSENKPPITKRKVLSSIAKLYDPLGFCAPAIFLAKSFMQHLWTLTELNWDDELPDSLQTKWIEYQGQMGSFKCLKIPRCISPVASCDIASIEIHGFGDASELGYGCCIYIRTTDVYKQNFVRLLCAKSRIAPLRRQTIPRLELCAALLLAQLMKKVISAMDINFTRIYFWSDSQITLMRLKSQSSHFTTFVANRISQVQELSSPDDWHYVASEDNPADIVSRGLMPLDLGSCNIWWNGPSFLKFAISTWPSPPESKLDITALDYRVPKITLTATKRLQLPIDIIDQVSDFTKLLRYAAIWRRFLKNRILESDRRTTGPISAEELEESLIGLTRYVQHQAFIEEIRSLNAGKQIKSSKILSLDPFVDKEGNLRVGGRLRNSSISYNQKHPLLLPANHTFTKRLLRHEHHRNLHAGPQALLYIIRQRFWIVNGRSICRNVVNNCLFCVRMKARMTQQIMGQLPQNRVEITRPFINAGVDFCGPFSISYPFRSKIVTKAYIALYICFATKAVHLEIVHDLSTAAFIASLRRFISRRGRPSNIYCDNATNFIGAQRELRKLYEEIQSSHAADQIYRACTAESIQFHFIPPRSPHFGGLWESAIRSAKRHLTAAVGSSKFTTEELLTVIAQCEACMNSRPITIMSSNPSDLTALTPGHFIIGCPLTALADRNFMDSNTNLLRRWQRMQQTTQIFWKRWSSEYLGELQKRTKWTCTKDKVRIGRLVVLKDENLPPLKWALGRIVNVHPGKDDIIRVVTITTATGTYKRALSKICLLPEIEDESSFKL